MKARIVTIGDEIVIGQITDTNSQYIASHLESVGINIDAIISVKDQENQIKEYIAKALDEVELVICTGGLGPTKDDITKSVFCSLFNCELQLHKASYDHVERLVKKKGIEFNELNQGQAYLPSKCTPLHNEYGTAPGMWFEMEKSILISLPGVPYEMKALMNDIILPKLKETFTLKETIHKTVLTYGIPESLLATQIAPWEDSLPPYLHLAYLPSAFGVRLRLSAYNVEEDVKEEIDQRFSLLKNILKEAYIGEGQQGASEILAASLLTENGQTLSVAESCTGGRLASRFTAISGASAYFLGSATCYSNEIKTKILGVNPKTLEEHGAVSEEVAIEMAKGVRKLTNSDFALSTTGVAGPSGGTEEKPVGTVWIGFASRDKAYAIKKNFTQFRDINIERSASEAINILRSELLKESSK